MAFCPNCGAQNEDGAKFCANCAAQLSDDTQQYNAGYGNQQFNPGDFAASAMAPEKKLFAKRKKNLLKKPRKYLKNMTKYSYYNQVPISIE